MFLDNFSGLILRPLLKYPYFSLPFHSCPFFSFIPVTCPLSPFDPSPFLCSFTTDRSPYVFPYLNLYVHPHFLQDIVYIPKLDLQGGHECLPAVLLLSAEFASAYSLVSSSSSLFVPFISGMLVYKQLSKRGNQFHAFANVVPPFYSALTPTALNHFSRHMSSTLEPFP